MTKRPKPLTNTLSAVTLALTAALTAALSGNAASAAGSFDPDKVTQSINIYEAVVAYPPPSWQTKANGIDEHEYNRQQQGPVFVFEQIPKGEKFNSWTKLYAVHGLYVGKAPTKPGLDFYVNASLGPFFQACGKENFSVQNLQNTPNAVSVVMFCTDSPNAPPGLGYGKGIGEIAVMTFRRHQSTFVKVYQEWRGDSFSLKDRASWPVNDAELKEMIRRIVRVGVYPAQPQGK